MLLVFKRLNVFVALLHLIFAVVNFLLELLVASLGLLEIGCHAVLGLLHRLQMTFEVTDGLQLVLELTLHALLLQVILCDSLLLRELRSVQLLVCLSELSDLAMYERQLVRLLADLLVLLLGKRLQVSFGVLQLLDEIGLL